MARVLVFGGTTEGRAIINWLASAGCAVTACSATIYGGSLVEGVAGVESLVARLDADQMAELMVSGSFDCVVDATHPFAQNVTENVRSAAASCGLPLVRIVRGEAPDGDWTHVADVREAADYLAQTSGKVLLTTGSKDLPTFVAAVPDFQERLFVRILPVAASLQQALDLGIPVNRIIAMQGPFSQELNEALIRSLGIDVMVSKASGPTGGFEEKARAAQATGCQLVVIDRPIDEGKNLEAAKEQLAALLTIAGGC